MKSLLTQLIENAGNFVDGSITKRILRRAANGEARPSELHYLSDAIDKAGDGDGCLEMGDIIDFAEDKIESVGEVVSSGFDILSDAVSSIFDFLG